MGTEQYKEIFINEAEEHLQMLNAAILQLERAPHDEEVLNKIFRSAHTLKGMSATMGFDKLTKLTHRMEDVLESFRKGEAKVNPDVIDVLLQCLDTLEELVAEVKLSEDKNIDIDSLLVALNNLLPGMAKVKKVTEQQAAITEIKDLTFNDIEKNILHTAKKDGFNIFKVLVRLIPGCELKSVRAFMVCRNAEEVADVIKSIPSAQDLEEGKFTDSFMLVVITRNDEEKINSAIMSIAEIEKVTVEKLEIQEKQPAAVQDTTQAEACAKDATSGVIRKIQNIRVSTERLDKLMNLVGELVISKIRLVQIAHVHRITDLEEMLSGIDRLTQELQDLVMQARLVPISHVFDRFPRMVRDLAKCENKQVDLNIFGGEIELDRTVLDEIGDPLVHLLRNAVDHGIELPEDRKSANKNPRGTITLKATRERTHVFVEVADDGRGIEARKIKELAVKKGFISSEIAKNMPDKDVLDILTLPGFSAAETVTDTSGRGVGMDVVKNKIEALGGSVELNTKVDKGSTFILKLPMTIAIIQAMLITVDDEIYAIPLGNIRETIKIEETQIKRIERHEVIQLRNEVLPILRLKNIFGAKHSAGIEKKQDKLEHENHLSIIIVEIGGKKAGLVVNTLIGQQEVVIKQIGSLLKGIKGFAGATILGDGKVALIIDVATLV